jgi:hypothetical protein
MFGRGVAIRIQALEGGFWSVAPQPEDNWLTAICAVVVLVVGTGAIKHPVMVGIASSWFQKNPTGSRQNSQPKSAVGNARAQRG